MLRCVLCGESFPSPAHPFPVTYHPGEIAVQKRVGVREQAEELTGMYRSALTAPLAAFLPQHRFAVLSSRDADANVWASPLAGPPGIFEVADPANLRVALGELDPQLDRNLICDGHAGLLVIDTANADNFFRFEYGFDGGFGGPIIAFDGAGN